MKKRLLTMMLAGALLLAGCGDPEVPGTTPTDDTKPNTTVSDTWIPEEEEIQYDWMAGESPIPNMRMGIERQGISGVVTETGTYFIYAPSWILDVTPPSPWILYVDHGSDTVIKLCGRPDCTHETTDCNAFVEGGSHLSYYDGYLYIISNGYDNSNYNPNTGEGIEDVNRLLRMKPDGTERVEILNMSDFAKENGGDFAECQMITEGYCVFTVNAWVPDGNQMSGESQGTYIYKLDGSMDEPKAVETGGWKLYNCGDVLLTWSPISENGGEFGSYWDWDPAADKLTFLTDHPGQPGWFGWEEGYYFKDGAVCRLTYATGEEEVLFETGLQGDYFASCFPDCIVVTSDAIRDVSDKNLYIYNWAFELVDTVEISCPDDAFMVGDCILAETAERLILTDSKGQLFPTYYIDKAELGTGNVELHRFDLSGLGSSLQYYEDYVEDQEWLENG